MVSKKRLRARNKRKVAAKKKRVAKKGSTARHAKRTPRVRRKRGIRGPVPIPYPNIGGR